MRSLGKWFAAVSVAANMVAVASCATTPDDGEGRAGRTSSAARTATEVSGSAGCPEGMQLLCRITIGRPGGNQCSPLILAIPMGGGTALSWESPSGQLVDAVIVSSGEAANLYEYSPPVSRDDELLVVPQSDGGGARLSRIDFCVVPDGGTDAGVDAPADAPHDAPHDAPTDAPSDAPTDARGPKMW